MEAICQGVSEIDITINGSPVQTALIGFIANRDGFESFNEMKKFFKEKYGSLPFKGYLIEWRTTE